MDLATVRNIGIAAHIDAGKTTTTERILFYSGRTHRMGEVDDGTTTTDFDEQEQQRGITIYSAAVSCPWRGHTINLIDTPGHVDFTAEVERALRVLDGMVAVFDAKEGVEAQSEKVWQQANKYGVPRICFINKMDRVGADFHRSVETIRERFDVRPLILQLPLGASNDFRGLIDLVEMNAVYFQQEKQGSSMRVTEIPDEYIDEATDYRHKMVESLAETCESVMDSYLHDQAIDAATLRKAIRAATLGQELVPVLCGSSLRFIGVQRMLDAVCDFLPSPLDVPPVQATDAKKRDVVHELPCDPSGPLAALVFKIVTEKPIDLYYLRIYSGTLKTNMRLLDSVTGGKENISRIYRMFAKRREQLDHASAGDIVAVVGPKNALTGHTLCDQRKPLILESIEFPETVISVSVEPKSARDRDKLFDALRALERQDPTLSVATNAETGQTLLSGMGELHLEVMVRRLRTDLNLDVAIGKPRVSYRETVAASGEGEWRFERSLGGRNHFAVVRLRIEPQPHTPGSPHFAITSDLETGELQAESLVAIETGIRDAAQSGVLGGYPVIDWQMRIVSVDQREGDSSEVAFENAARLAFYEAMKEGSPVLLQPIMSLEIVTADEYFGAIMTDLKARQAVVRDSAQRGSDRVIEADVPLAQLFGYVTRLRSISQGRATSSMVPARYAAVSAEQMKALVG